MRHNTGIYPYTNHAGLRYIAHVSLEVSSFFLRETGGAQPLLEIY